MPPSAVGRRGCWRSPLGGRFPGVFSVVLEGRLPDIARRFEETIAYRRLPFYQTIRLWFLTAV